MKTTLPPFRGLGSRIRHLLIGGIAVLSVSCGGGGDGDEEASDDGGTPTGDRPEAGSAEPEADADEVDASISADDDDSSDGAGGDGGEGSGGAGNAGDSGPAGASGSGGSVGAGAQGGAGGEGAAGEAAGGSGAADAGGGTQVDPSPGVVARMIDELGLGQRTEEWTATISRDPLPETSVINPAGGVSDFAASAPYSFMFLNLEPRAEFEHPVQFVFAEGDAPLVAEDHGFWPYLDGIGFAVSDVPTVKLFPPVSSASPERGPYPGEGGTDFRGASPEQILFAIEVDPSADTGQGRIFFYASADLASATPGYVNFLADLDGDGEWEPDAGERLVTNFVLSSQSAGWVFTDPFPIPVDGDNKFAPKLWTRLALSSDPIPDDEDDSSSYCTGDIDYTCTDQDYDFGTWTGGDCDSDYDPSGCTITFGPERENPPVPEIEGAETSFICQPDGLIIPTLTKALLIHMGDNPGEDRMEYTMRKLAAALSLRYGDDGVATMNCPTRERAIEAIGAFMSGVECPEELHLSIVGHGFEGSGALYAGNGGGSLTPADVHKAITENASHCPPMDYAIDGCNSPGYCNLNIFITGCYSGNFTQGDASLALPGINILTSASSEVSSYGEHEGFEKGSKVAHAFTQGFVGGAADAAPYGNGDGRVDQTEAQNYAKANYDKGYNDLFASDPQLSQQADCDCYCEAEPCGNGIVDVGEECDPLEISGSCSTNYMCSEECTCECALTQQDCSAGEVLDVEECQCVEACGNAALDAGEECDPAEGVERCSGNFACGPECSCECTLLPNLCDPGTTFDSDACECVPINHCPPMGSFNLWGQFSTFSDPSKHSCCHNVPIGSDVSIPFTLVKTFTSPGLPGQDVPPLSGTMVNDPLSGCMMAGSGSGTFASYPNSMCLLQNAVILDGMFTGRLQCTPSGFPGQPITFEFDATVVLP